MISKILCMLGALYVSNAAMVQISASTQGDAANLSLLQKEGIRLKPGEQAIVSFSGI